MRKQRQFQSEINFLEDPFDLLDNVEPVNVSWSVTNVMLLGIFPLIFEKSPESNQGFSTEAKTIRDLQVLVFGSDLAGFLLGLPVVVLKFPCLFDELKLRSEG